MEQESNTPLQESIQAVERTDTDLIIRPGTLVIDTRPNVLFRDGHIQGAVNIQEGAPFAACLQAVVGTDELFYLVAQDVAARERMILATAAAGYVHNIIAALVFIDQDEEESDILDLEDFKNRPEAYAVIDVRSREEIQRAPLFKYSIEIPLDELRRRIWETKSEKPLVVHSAGGYRSAVASSLIRSALTAKKVYDLGENIKYFQNK
jgi:hydroxyacylglutathione hydrolase